MTGIILAGGKNTRIGTNKAFIKINKKTIIEIILAVFYDLFKEVIIVTNCFKEYQHLGVKLVKDIIPDKNSLGGLYSGLLHAAGDYSFVAACDMPFIKRSLISYMMQARYGYDAIIPEYNGTLQPLCAVYSKTCINPIKEALSQNNLKIIDIVRHMQVKRITEAEINNFDLYGHSFININTFQEYMRYKDGVLAFVTPEPTLV